MRIYETRDYGAMSRRCANILSAHVIVNPACVLGLATGATPVEAYRQLAQWCRNGDLSFAEVRTVNLDEYLDPAYGQCYRRFMQENLFDSIDIRLENTHIPNGLTQDPHGECARYNRVIRELGGIDLQLLGMGRNGHIGFNEPGHAFELETHVVELSQTTRAANARFFPNGAVPRRAITMGIKSIMQARRILVAVSGEEKAQAVLEAFRGPVTPEVPASILQLHPDVTLVGDRDALHKLLAWEQKEGL